MLSVSLLDGYLSRTPRTASQLIVPWSEGQPELASSLAIMLVDRDPWDAFATLVAIVNTSLPVEGPVTSIMLDAFMRDWRITTNTRLLPAHLGFRVAHAASNPWRRGEIAKAFAPLVWDKLGGDRQVLADMLVTAAHLTAIGSAVMTGAPIPAPIGGMDCDCGSDCSAETPQDILALVAVDLLSTVDPTPPEPVTGTTEATADEREEESAPV